MSLSTFEVIRRMVDQVAGRIPVIAGTGGNSTRESVELTSAAKTVGADACLLVTPYYNKPTQEGLYLHFRHIAESVAIPQILYNVPGRTVCDMLPRPLSVCRGLPTSSVSRKPPVICSAPASCWIGLTAISGSTPVMTPLPSN
jgi:dihydrodipicolinate synthase/N-acetylneuraminate lyase